MDLLEGESLRRFGQRIWGPYRAVSSPISSTQELTETEDLHAHPTVGDGANSASPPPQASPPGESVPPAAGQLERLLAIMRRFCATLAYLHGEGFVNGDLKPENVLLVNDEPVIIDFGLTAHHPGGCGREALETQWGMAGTLPYMSPEQIRGELLDARSDLYSVGCMLYELTTGVQPFVGSAAAIIHQHLAMTPPSPSEFVKGMSKELERLILNLLEKDLGRRCGYADEVAAQLAELARDGRPLTGFPSPRPYIYRPRLTGREDELSLLATLREQASKGAGALVLLGGESGVGKTRLAMELTRAAPGSHMRAITSEASALASESAAAVGPAPLHALRTLLQAVADRCHEGGAHVTERLLGHRRSVLAMYEPALAHVPAEGTLTPIIPLGVGAARQRLFKYLAEVVGHLADEQPLLWVIDDLGWADELSLAFLRSLTREYLEAHRLLIVCAYRTEDPSPEISAIASQPHVHHIILPRLGTEVVNSMIGDMLAIGDSLDGFTEFVARQAEGNPFFVAEYLRAAVAERILRRGQRHSWYLAEQASQLGSEQSPLQLPHSLLSLIERRLGRLSPNARQTALAAAVLGRDAELGVLFEVAGLQSAAFSVAVDELIRRQVLEQPGPAKVCFAHDKLREVACARADPEELRGMHAGAAAALEKHWSRLPDASSQWATLGYHFQAAQLPERAAYYLQLAADHARQSCANSDAIRLYREAIKQVEQILLRLESEPASWREILLELYETMGDVLALTAQREAAQSAYLEAEQRTPEDRPVARARLHRKIGTTWASQHRHDEALRFYALAKQSLTETSPEHREEWIQVHLDQLWVHYLLNQVADMKGVIDLLQPLIATYATPLQRALFFQTQLLFCFRRDRYLVTEKALSYAVSAVRACEDAEYSAELPPARFVYGLALLCHGSLDAAETELHTCLAAAQRTGDTQEQVRCLAYLTVCARMQRRLDETRGYARQTALLAHTSGMLEYLGVARANEAWVALRAGDFDSVTTRGREALESWQDRIFPFQWMALLPLLESELHRENLAEAVACAQALLEPTQQFLPGAAEDALGRAVDSWKRGDAAGSVAALRTALKELSQTGYG